MNAVEMREMTFKYEGALEPALKGINLKIKEGGAPWYSWSNGSWQDNSVFVHCWSNPSYN